MDGDSEWNHRGRSHAIGYMQGLIRIAGVLREKVTQRQRATPANCLISVKEGGASAAKRLADAHNGDQSSIHQAACRLGAAVSPFPSRRRWPPMSMCRCSTRAPMATPWCSSPHRQDRPGRHRHLQAGRQGPQCRGHQGHASEGAEPFKGKTNEELVVTFTVPGAYGVKCLPHFAMGMVGLIVVGDAPANLEALKAVKLPKSPPSASRRCSSRPAQ